MLKHGYGPATARRTLDMVGVNGSSWPMDTSESQTGGQGLSVATAVRGIEHGSLL
jgi:hypothetical protein